MSRDKRDQAARPVRTAVVRERFEARKLNTGRDGWRIYDRLYGCYPYTTRELGPVVQDVGEAAARAEADRLNTAHGPY